MESLAIKYRPTAFSEVVGQSSTTTILESQISYHTFKNAYLFTGSAGTGKTTCARIFASEINRHKGIPIEIDAASHNSVDDVREIINQAQTKSIDSEYKVFIIDECHSISSTGWQAFLKLLEEPPAKTIFIFCTTNPEKIPKTILSRVQRYNFKRMSTNDIVNRLKFIIDKENNDMCDRCGNDFCSVEEYEESAINIRDEESLEYIAKLSDGGMRDAITMLDKCISYNNNLTFENVLCALDRHNPDIFADLCDAMLNKKQDIIIKIIEDTYSSGADLRIFANQFTYFLLDVCKYCLSGSFEYTTMITKHNENWLKSIASSFDSITSFLDEMTKLNSEIKFSDNPKYMLEATLLLMGR